MTTTTGAAPMSAAEVLAMMEQSARHADERGHVIAAENMRMAITAVSAMAEREAALVREVEALRRFALDVKDACAPDGVVNQPAIYEMACDITARAEARDG